MKIIFSFAFALFLSINAQARHHRHSSRSLSHPAEKPDVLIKLANSEEESPSLRARFESEGVQVEKISDEWLHLRANKSLDLKSLAQDPEVESVQPNYKINLLEDFSIKDPLRRAALARLLARNPELREVNPDQAAPPLEGFASTNSEIVVAVLDTGVNYSRKDLLPHIWKNKKEIPGNNVDDDNNGYVDDVIGWDFVANNNSPYDFTQASLDILLQGGNPGHGTHSATLIATTAPQVKIMPLRMISEKSLGTTAEAIKAIHYAVENGARVIHAAWSAEGESSENVLQNKALSEAIDYAEDHGVLFITAAGDGHKDIGFDNDLDPKPQYPATYDHDVILSVTALDEKNQLPEFANWGAESVDLAAPGTATSSELVIDKYGFTAAWDGSSMAASTVSGAVGAYWSAHPEKSWQDVKTALLRSVRKVDSLAGKCVSGGKLDIKALLND